MMQQNEKMKDWLFRYHYIYRLRRSEKNKRRFLTALVTDISELREDIQVIEYNRQKKYASRNVYVGDIETADRIICAYYDTPPQNFGSYVLFNRQEQGKRTMNFILVTSALAILTGLLGTFLYMKNSSYAFDLTSIHTLLFVLIFGLYFFLLGKVTQGLSNRKTLIRNTSSILTLLAMISGKKDRKTAYAFIDEGSYGEKGLEALRTSAKKNAKIFCLDCVGADAPLHILGKDSSKKKAEKIGIDYVETESDINYIFSGRVSEDEKNHYYLTKSDLKQKNINNENMVKVMTLFD